MGTKSEIYFSVICITIQYIITIYSTFTSSKLNPLTTSQTFNTNWIIYKVYSLYDV